MKILKVGALLFIFAIIVSTAASFAQEGVLKIGQVEGDVLVRIYPQTEWAAAKAGQVLNPKDGIKTLESSRAFLDLPNGGGLSLKPNTEILVEDLIWDAATRKIGLKMSAGDLKAIIKKVETPSEFTVKTPNAVCGAYGSIVYTRYRGNRTTGYSEDSMLRFSNAFSGRSLDIGAGLISYAGDDGSLTDPAQPLQDEINDLTSGFLEGLVAEPYGEPIATDAATDVSPPDPIQDGQASRI